MQLVVTKLERIEKRDYLASKVAEDFPDQKSTSNLHTLARVYKHEIGTGKRMDGTLKRYVFALNCKLKTLY